MRHFLKSLIILFAQLELGVSERVPKETGFGQQPVNLSLVTRHLSLPRDDEAKVVDGLFSAVR
jgi:hypothetical protein